MNEIKENVGWDLIIAGGLKVAEEPTEAELTALRAADPANLIMGGLEARRKLSGLDEFVELTLNHARRWKGISRENSAEYRQC